MSLATPTVALLLGPYRNLSTLTASLLHLHPSVPVAGSKDSGIGADYGVDGMKQYTQTTVIRMAK